VAESALDPYAYT